MLSPCTVSSGSGEVRTKQWFSQFMEDVFNLSSSLLKVVESHYQHRVTGECHGHGPMQTTSYDNRTHMTVKVLVLPLLYHGYLEMASTHYYYYYYLLLPYYTMPTNFEMLQRIPSSLRFFVPLNTDLTS